MCTMYHSLLKEEEKTIKRRGCGCTSLQISNQFTRRTLFSYFCWQTARTRCLGFILLAILHQLVATILHMDRFRRIFGQRSSGWAAILIVKVLMSFCSFKLQLIVQRSLHCWTQNVPLTNQQINWDWDIAWVLCVRLVAKPDLFCFAPGCIIWKMTSWLLKLTG